MRILRAQSGVCGPGLDNTIRAYVVEDNYLAALYVCDLLDRQPMGNLRVVESRLLDQSTKIDGNNCIIFIDQSYFLSKIFSFGRKLKTCFPQSSLIIIGCHVLGDRIRKVFREWVLATVDYHEIQQLPAIVCNAISNFSEDHLRRFDLAGVSALDPLRDMHLSKREVEVLELVSLRLCNKEIAELLNLAESTVKFHVSNAFIKMGIRRRREFYSLLSQ
jgi:DNA-binding CsgD family transcriptional regulator